MKEKVVLVTGGGTGIGRAIAQRFIELAASVVITGRRESKLSDATKGLGKNASYIVGDVTESDVPKRMIQDIVEKQGRLDVLVNNAGIGSGDSLIDVTDSEIESVFKKNLFAPLALTREALPELIKTKVQSSISPAPYLKVSCRRSAFTRHSKPALTLRRGC